MVTSFCSRQQHQRGRSLSYVNREGDFVIKSRDRSWPPWRTRTVNPALLSIPYSHHKKPIFFSQLPEMAEVNSQKTVVVGAGPVGALAALYAAQRGHDVEVYELRSGTSGFTVSLGDQLCAISSLLEFRVVERIISLLMSYSSPTGELTTTPKLVTPRIIARRCERDQRLQMPFLLFSPSSQDTKVAFCLF